MCSKEGVAAALTSTALLPSENEELKLPFSGVIDLDSLRLVYSVSILNILPQIKANSAFRAAGGRHGRLSLQSRMHCLRLPPLPGDWVSSASPTLCGGALHLLWFKKNPKTFWWLCRA